MTDTSLTILHADPRSDDAARVRDCLQALGHRVLHAGSSAAAMALFDATPPQLAIVDEALDDGEGLQMVRRLRSAVHDAWLPVLVTAGAAAARDDFGRAIDAGADDWLARPLDLDLLAQRVRALQRFAAVHSGLLEIIDHVLEAIIVIDGSGIVRAFNAAAEAVFGYAAAEVIGRNVSMLMPSPYREEHDRYIASYLHSRKPRVIGVGRQVVALRRNGEAFPVSLAVSAVKGARSDTFIGLVRDLSPERERERYAHMALHDPLTGLPNRIHLVGALDDAAVRAGRPGHGLALLFIDVDRFKDINDRFGHAIGDAVLVTLAGRLRHSVNRKDLVARLSGDEFVVLLDGVADPSTADAVALRLREAAAAPMVFDGCSLQVGISVGVAVHGLDGERPDDLLRAADLAMYRAKAGVPQA
jgi:diguanylate cyclase (GGDEF)-like protein/PAS domain S-box-containing protein